MSYLSWEGGFARALRQLFTQPASKRRPSRCLPSVEELETRTLMSIVPALQGDTLPPLVTVGQASITTVLPAGRVGPSRYDSAGHATPSTPNVTADFTGPVDTNDWWSSLIFSTQTGAASSNYTLYPDPFAVKAYADGLGLSYPTNVHFITGADGQQTAYEFNYAEDLKVGLTGLGSPGVKTERYSDWTVTTAWQNGAAQLHATIGHGLPYTYFTTNGGNEAVLSFAGPVSVWSNQGGVLGVTVNGHNYGLFGPSAGSWSQTGNTLKLNLSGKDYFSVALLPDNSAVTLAVYRAHAYAFVTDTKVAWQYNEQTSQVVTTYTATTQLKESGNGNLDQSLMALYRHQYLDSADALTSYTYQSPRGQMKVLAGSGFTTTATYHGTLPVLPAVGVDKATLYAYVDQVYKQNSLFPATPTDTYGSGKNLQEIANLITLADQVGYTAARDRFLSEVKAVLQDWFSATDGGGEFYYDKQWNSLIGYPSSYGSDTRLSDHHFHYGYIIEASAIVAQFDPQWATQWGGAVELLIKDVDNGERDDKAFEFLRFFDPYAGHSWADGAATFAAGNNQESSSEAINFANAVISWGNATGNKTLRDLGIYLYTTETEAIKQYWFDEDHAVFPKGFTPNTVGIVWGNGGAFATFFTAKTEDIHAINFLPFTGGSLYLGQNVDYVRANYNSLVRRNGGPENEWVDRVWMYQALADPNLAVAKFQANPNYQVSDGDSRAWTYAWIYNLNALGHVDTTVTADTSSYAVFSKNGARTYVAYNYGASPLTVHFSDGFTLQAAPHTLVSGGANASTWTPKPVTPTTTPTNVLYVIDQQDPSADAGKLGRLPADHATSDTVSSAAGGRYTNAPAPNALTYLTEGLTGAYQSGGSTAFRLLVDSGVFTTGQRGAVDARISYDFNGDGVYDRVETYNLFATDAVAGYEEYNQHQGIQTATGTFADFHNGRVKLEVWNAFGTQSAELRTSAPAVNASQIVLPFTLSDTAPPPPPALPTVSVGDVSLAEGNSGTRSAVFAVTLSAASSQPVTVNYATGDGTALAGQDFQAASGSVTFQPGETSKQVAIVINGDTVVEPDETFTLNLSAPSNATLARGQGIGTIVNDDVAPPPPPPTLGVGDVSLTEGNSGTKSAVFAVTLSAVSGQAVTVNYATRDGTALGGQDYRAASGTVTFLPGETSKQVAVAVIGDTVVESDETFTLTLSAPSNAILARGQGVGTIVNDDAAPPPPPVVDGSIPAFVVTAHDTVPVFGRDYTVKAVGSGLWTDPHVWSRPPVVGDSVYIPAGVSVVLNSSVDVSNLLVAGRFTLLNTASLKVTNLFGLPGSEIVTPGDARNIQIVIKDTPLGTTADPYQYGNGFISFGRVFFTGAYTTPFARTASVAAGSRTIVLDRAPVGWNVADKLSAPDTRQLTAAQGPNYDESEVRSIVAIAGNVVTLDQALTYGHTDAPIANLTRSIVLRSENPAGTRGHVLFADTAEVRVENTALQDLGRTDATRALDVTRMNTDGSLHVGANQTGRYSLYLDHLVKPFSIRSDVVEDGRKFGIAIDGSHFGTVTDNVVFRVDGAGLTTVAGNDTGNLIAGNLVMNVRRGYDSRAVKLTDGSGLIDTGLNGSAYWFRGPSNIVRGNIGVASAVGFTYDGTSINPAQRVPTMPGQPESAFVSVDHPTPLESRDNEARAVGVGLSITWTEGQNPAKRTDMLFENYRISNVFGNGVETCHADGVILRNFVIANGG